MADEECGKNSASEGSPNSDGRSVGSESGSEKTRIVISRDVSDKEDEKEDEDSDSSSRVMYTANRGFPPSRFAPRSSFSSPQTAPSPNPFAVKSSVGARGGCEAVAEGTCSWQGLTPSKLGSFGSSPFGGGISPAPLASKIFLKPASFDSSSPTVAAAPKSAFPLNPSRLPDPFPAPNPKSKDDWKDEEQKKEELAGDKAKTACSVKFVPLGGGAPHNSASAGPDAASLLTATFVFGQNLHERVVDSVQPTTSDTAAHENGSAEEAKEAEPSTNGTAASEMLFSAVMKKESGDSNSEPESTPAKSLSEAAREYEESRAVKRKFEEVEVKTGEEEETNVLQISCKLHTFDKAKGSWAERGRGQLRLNDKVQNHVLQSRVIMRTHGSLRVVLNTKVWADMSVDRANVKSVRFTAMDDDQIKVFLVTATTKEAENLHTALERRVSSQRMRSSSSSATGQMDEGADVPSPDTAISDVEQTRSCADPEPCPKKGKPPSATAPSSQLNDQHTT